MGVVRVGRGVRIRVDRESQPDSVGVVAILPGRCLRGAVPMRLADELATGIGVEGDVALRVCDFGRIRDGGVVERRNTTERIRLLIHSS